MVLGWRWVPGQELVYQGRTELILSEGRMGRSEVWTYLVREVDRRGTATLEARRVGLGGGLEGEPGRHPLPSGPRAEQLGLRLTMDGLLEDFHPEGFGAGWPHRALALRLPERPVEIYDEWPDAQLVRAFAGLLPLGDDLELRGSSRLAGLELDQGRHRARLSSEGRIRTEEGLEVRVKGAATWDADRGLLAERSLAAWLQPEPRQQEPGRLELRLSLRA